ncbi:MAG TPA: recombinase RecT [Steroidobacter sp.]|uniref:recombinase RecT n=1 Tax=Steroidobacter sp. TaxID=1978227 RepID=UPI002EDAEFDB
MSAAQNAVAKRSEKQNFPAMLETFKGEIARALPSHLTADRMMRIALTEFRKNPKLGQCDPRSVFAAIIMSSQLGLEPGILGQSYLVPYKTECQLIPGWQGFVDLVSRTGRATCWTGAVYRGDQFDYALGDRPFITHRPGDDVSQHPDNLRYLYAVGRVKGAEWPVIEVWSAEKVIKHRNYFNKVGDRHYSFEHFEMYGRKVPLLQVIKYMPKSVELQRAQDLEYASQRGSQLIDISSASDGSWVPPESPDDHTEGDGGSRADAMKDKLRGGSDVSPALLDNAHAISELKKPADVAGLEKVWVEIGLAHSTAKRDIHPDVEDLYKARKEELTKL